METQHQNNIMTDRKRVNQRKIASVLSSSKCAWIKRMKLKFLNFNQQSINIQITLKFKFSLKIESKRSTLLNESVSMTYI